VTIRVSKALLLCALGFFYALVVFNNTNDYNSNLAFVRHVLSMDTTFPGNNGMWRAIRAPSVHMLFFVSIVIWETVTGILCWWGAIRLLRNLRASAAAYNAAKNLGVIALTLSRSGYSPALSRHARRRRPGLICLYHNRGDPYPALFARRGCDVDVAGKLQVESCFLSCWQR
jgi:predicted small integral membrane protein